MTMAHHLLPLCLTMLLPLFSMPPIHAASLSSQSQALLLWKASLLNTSTLTLSSWNPSLDPCSNWKGISCSNIGSTNGPITHINLQRAGLVGNLETLNFSALPFLVVLNLRRNFLTGPIPPDIGTLSALISLDLALNYLSSELPTSLANLSKITEIDLSNNGLSGEIPPQIFANWTHLGLLRLYRNQLSGSIPPQSYSERVMMGSYDGKASFKRIMSNVYNFGLVTLKVMMGRHPSNEDNHTSLKNLLDRRTPVSSPFPSCNGGIWVYGLRVARLNLLMK